MDSAGTGAESAVLGERVLVLAPVGRDAPLLCQVLGAAGIRAVVCGDPDELLGLLRWGAGAVLLTEEALAPAALTGLLDALSAAPLWSDLPVVLLADGEPSEPHRARAVAAVRTAGNLMVLERPTRGLSLVTAIQAALRARKRQYEVRDLVEREREARRDAEAASQIKDEFLATVSHELRTPLSAILLWSRLLRTRRVGEQDMQHALQAIERSAEAQSKLIEDLLDMSRMMSGKLHLNLQEADLGPVAQAAMDIVLPAAEAKRIQLEAAVEPAIGAVWTDPDRIQQILWNLLSNAVKFTPPGGRVALRLWSAGGHVHIEVADTGKGISPQFLPHVFERFRQADATAQRKEGGLGLGLAISRQLVELHGGTIHAHSAGEGHGAVFTVELPLTPAAAPAATPRGPAAPSRSLDGIRVLLVEDDRDTREAMAHVLGQYGAEVTQAASAGAAIEVLAAARPDRRPHALVSDLAMPEMDGYELLRRIRTMEKARGEPALPAVVITAYAREEDRARALEAGFAAHVAKPIEVEHLVAVVEQVIRQQG